MFCYEVTAKNYGADHANKIHSDEGAANYGFAGALVPGVGLYAYLTRPIIETLGFAWLESGWMKARFIHPVYDSENVRAQVKAVSADPVELGLELLNSSNILCATGSAGLPQSTIKIDPDEYPTAPLPDSDRRHPPTIAGFSIGDIPGSLEFTLDLAGEDAKFLDNVVETLPIYRGADAICHPAFFIAQANEILMRNVALGPWIHTASEVRHYSIAVDGDHLSMRGRVIDLFEKRGNEYMVLDLVIFSTTNRPVVQIKHSAIIRLRGEEITKHADADSTLRR